MCCCCANHGRNGVRARSSKYDETNGNGGRGAPRPTDMWGPEATVLDSRVTHAEVPYACQPAGPRFKGPLASQPWPKEQPLAGGASEEVSLAQLAV
jgi:hypothetical protein